MDVSGDVADLMVKESIQLTEAGIRMMAEGSKNLMALLFALAQDGKKLSGKTSMARLLREGKTLKVFRLKESDLEDFKRYARKNVLFAAVKDDRATDGMVDLITNVDFVSQVNLFMERRGYAAPLQSQEEASKKDGPLARQDSSLPQRGNGWTASRTRPTRTTSEEAQAQTQKPSVKDKLAEARKRTEQRTHPSKSKTR